MKYKIDTKELAIDFITELISSLIVFKLLSYLDMISGNLMVIPALLYSMFIVMISLSTSQIYPMIQKMENIKSTVSIITCMSLNVSIYFISRYLMLMITEKVFENQFYIAGIQGRVLVIAIAFVIYYILTNLISNVIRKMDDQKLINAMKQKKREQQKRIQIQKKNTQHKVDLKKH